MRYLDFIPRKDADFIQWINSFILNLQSLLNKANMPPARYEKIMMLKTVFVDKFNVAENPSTRTPISVQDKNTSRDSLEKELRKAIKEFITYNSDLSDAERKSLGLHIHKTSRTPSPVSESYPFVDVDSSIIRRLSIHYYDTGSTSKAKPAGQHGVEVRWSILASPPVSINDLINSVFDTRTPCTLEFDESQRGKTVYICLCWENTRGEKGPWSEIISAIIP